MIQSAVNYEIDPENIKKVALELAESEGSGKTVENTHKKMKESLTPPQNLEFSKIGQIQGGVKFLVDLMKDIIETLKTLKPAGSDFVSLTLMKCKAESIYLISV